MKTSTFEQQINGVSYTITVPQHRVETICDRVDRFIERNQMQKALDAISEFIGAAPVMQDKPKKLNSTQSIIEEHRSQGRYFVMEKLVESGMSKASAYYHARKAGLV